MGNVDIIGGYLAAERPYNVCVRTNMGGYMEFIKLESGIMFEENARLVAYKYVETMKKGDVNPNFLSVCVRKGVTIVSEIVLTKTMYD